MANDLLNTLNDISTSLAILAQQIRSEALAGLGSRSKVAEHVFLPVLRCVYSSPSLANTNTLSANVPGLDLFDQSTGLGVQVTSETAASKISETIDTVIKQKFPIKQLVVALSVNDTPSYQARTRAKWVEASNGHFAFDPSTNVFAFDRLLTRIQNLQPAEISEIAAVLQSLVRGTHRIHLLPHLRQQVDAQLAEEKRIARYIPDVFVETQGTKYRARCFAHPALFVRHITGWFNRQPFAGINRLAVMSGVPPVNVPSIAPQVATETPEAATATAHIIAEELARLDGLLSKYSEIGRAGGAEVPRDKSKAHILDETQYYIEISARSVQHRISDRREEFGSVSARIFLLTGPAGQGKTNFLCDFTERFLRRHDIPCAYITARQMSRFATLDLVEVVRKLIFPSPVTSLEEGLTNLEAACSERRQPFILVIDGLNEHPDVRAFAGQLEHLLETLVRFPFIRVLMTCRSEFLEQRFGSLITGALAPSLYISKAHGQRFDDEQYRELVLRYFRFFKVRPSLVSTRIIEFLQRDILLLRFFCEAYGARGREGTYNQPFIAGIYRDEIFRKYVEDKLGRAQRAIDDDRTNPRPLARRSEIGRVLSLVAAHMLEKNSFADVPRKVVPPELDQDLTALLDEELILRRDLAPAPSLIAEPTEVLNFTFDEMRDFMLAQHLLGVQAQIPNEFNRLLALQQPTATQSIEGVQRFLFYASRVPTNRAFFEIYRTHPWYNAVYDTEVFAVPQAHLDEGDQNIVVAALTAGGLRARHFAREVALCWEASTSPMLNLDLLLSVARRADQRFFTDVIVPTFGHANYGQTSFGDAFYGFIEDKVLPKFAPNEPHPYNPVFQLLLLLLPVNATPTLDSAALAVFRRLMGTYPAYAFDLLRDAIQDGQRWHRASLWRLLSEVGDAAGDISALLIAGRVDVGDANLDPSIRREAERFIARMSAEVDAQ